ncbi:neural cell adhesion molecule L1-like protein isoform X2 [Eublepharis macularius]|uniref:Neural cell adhesion molecule L1-like protein n=1 Tax=Eublepharis macularius TaxID=481883 RepID=A0AA97J718_EUBMA|nr:neural cell adhesion molecule L1-like protein isoform X2 [Eublepharis macularius]
MEMPLSTKGIAVSLLLFVLSLAGAIEIPLSVRQLPSIKEQSTTEVAFPFDEEFTIKCKAKGNPPPIFNWTKDGKPFDLLSDPRILPSNSSGTFVIRNQGNISIFQGKYCCYAINELGTTMSEEIELIVPGIPKFPKEKINPKDVEHGDSVVLHCNPPKGIPPLHIYWMNIDLQHIPQDERVSMSLQGDLYFANVDENDSRSDYCCFAAFPRLRTIVQKMPMTLTVTRSKHANDSSSPSATAANLIKERKPRLLIPPESSGHSSDVTVIKGNDLFLECIAEGLPTPHLTWNRVNRGVIDNYGKVLMVEKVTPDDGGRYICIAKNALGETRHEFNVHIEEPPSWVDKPQSGVYSIGENLVLLCNAIGNPEPTIKWKRNGQPLGEIKHSRGMVTTREISIIQLQLQDSAVYQCEATNNHGTILATANVDVLDIRPEVLTPDDEEYVAVVGYASYLHCLFFAVPLPDITWSKEDSISRLDMPPYYQYQNGTLEIRETRKTDSGSYTCWVSNSVGRSAITATLTVRDATKVSVTPKNPQVLKSHSIEFKCHSEYDSHLRHHFKISWRKDGEELDMNRTEGRIIIEMDTLLIPSVELEDNGVYTCVGSTSLDSAVDDTRLTVLHIPDPPEDLYLSEKQIRSVRLSWTAGNSNNSPINESIVEFEENRWEPRRWQELIKLPGNVTTAVVPLAPYINYQFRVISINGVGRSQPSEPSERYETPPAAPDRNPENIRVEASEPHEMIMKWEPLRPMEQNGPGMEYKVSWRRQGIESDWNEETVKKHSLILKNTPTFIPYDIKVQAVNNLGSGPEPIVITGYSSEDIPEAAPSNVIVQVINSTLAKAIWSTIPKDRVRGHLRGYKVSWWKIRSRLDGKNHHPEKHSLMFNADRNDGMIPGLEPFSEYRLTVLAFNSKGAGPESLMYDFQTPEGVPEKPHFLKILNFDKESVTLSWGPPKKPNGIVTGYILQYQIINETDDIGPLHEVNITNPLSFTLRLSNLSASTKYKFYAKACTLQGCGKPITEEGITITEGTYAGIYERISTQGWFIGLMGAIALLTLLLLTVCFVKRNKGGKYSVKEKEDLHPDPEGQSIKDEIFGEYSDSDEKPLKGSLRSLDTDIKTAESADSLVEYGEGDHRMFNEDGSFIGAYTGCKEKASVESIGSSTATFPLHA